MSANESPRGETKSAWRSRLVTIASGGAAVAYALFVFVPGQQSIASLQKTLRAQESQVSRSLTLVQPIREIEDKLAATEQFIKSWRGKAPAPDQVAAVFAEVISLARENDVEVTSLSPQAEQPLETIGLIPVALQATGSYRSLRGMIQRLEAKSGLVWIEELHLQPQDKQTDVLTCTIKLEIFANRSEISG
jgi:Tfp pilus assembly protein PilO